MKFLMCWLRVYAWLRVKLKVKGTGVRSVLSWSLYHRTNEAISYVLATRLRVATCQT